MRKKELFCYLLGKKVFKFSGPVTLGCVAGARCGVASIGAMLLRAQFQKWVIK